MAETRGCHTRNIDVIVKVPIRRIDRECKHKLWSPNMLASTTVLFGPWLWGRLVVDHKKLRLGSAPAKNSPLRLAFAGQLSVSPQRRWYECHHRRRLLKRKAHFTATGFAAIQRPNVPDMCDACG